MKRSLIISDKKILDWLDAHSSISSRSSGISALSRQLITLGIILFDKGFRINENGQLLKEIQNDEVESLLFNKPIQNKVEEISTPSIDNNKYKNFGKL